MALQKFFLFCFLILITIGTYLHSQTDTLESSHTSTSFLLNFIQKPAVYGVTNYFITGKNSCQTIFNYGFGYSSPDYFYHVDFLRFGFGLRYSSETKPEFRKKFTLLDISSAWEAPIYSRYFKDSSFTNYLRWQFHVIAIDHDQTGIPEFDNRWFQFRAEFIYDKRRFKGFDMPVETTNIPLKFQSKCSFGLGWTSYLPGTANFGMSNFNPEIFYRALEFNTGITLSLLNRARWAISAEYESRWLLQDNPLKISTAGLRAYYIIPLKLRKSIRADDGIELDVRLLNRNISNIAGSANVNSLVLSIQYNGFVYIDD